MQKNIVQRLLHYIRYIGEKLYITPEEKQLLGDNKSFWFKMALIGVLIAPIVFLFLPLTLSNLQKLFTNRSLVPIPREQWKVIYRGTTEKEKCSEDARNNKSCFANPNNNTLWNSPFTRADNEHYIKLRKLQGKAFWVGTKITPGQLKTALVKNANIFVVGYIKGDYRLWVNGKLILQEKQPLNFTPISFPISFSDLKNNKPLDLVVEITHNMDRSFPDFFEPWFGEGLTTGFLVDALDRLKIYQMTTQRLLFFGLNFVIGLLFVFFWISAPRKQEYSYMGIFAIIHALIQIYYVEDFRSVFDFKKYYFFLPILSFYEAAFALFLSCSFARIRRKFFEITIPIALLTPIFFFFLLSDSIDKLMVDQAISQWFIASAYWMGAGMCFLQSFVSMQDYRAVTRFRRLLIFGTATFIIGFLQFNEAQKILIIDGGLYIWYQFFHFVLMLGLSAIVISEYRDAELVRERIMLTPFHLQKKLPEKVFGLLVNLDLRDSTYFYRLGAEQGYTSGIVNRILLRFEEAFTRQGSLIIKKNGDELYLFFPQNNSIQKPIKNAWLALQEIQRTINLLEDQILRETDNITVKNIKVRFRISMKAGAIKPVMNNRFPDWEDVEHNYLFRHCNRMLSFSKQELEVKYSDSIVIMNEGLAKELESENIQFVIREKKWLDKDGDEHILAAVIIQPKSEIQKAA